ncbi:MAG: MlaA family lipoprotein [Betaproteobacteria bacterium]|nr:MlaA family lipoprotein [Betaproteobacteria bacterium]
MMTVLLALVLFTSGCASNGDPRDPLEPLNRAIYHFNDGVDHLLVMPAAELYQGRLIPEFVRTGLRNFFSNINDVIVFLNDLLQGKFQDAESDLGRIVINSTAGILGFIDVATDAGLVKHQEDFGQTLGVWGLGDGPYLVLPLIGPSSVRDTVGFVGDAYMWPLAYVSPTRTRNQIALLRYIGLRADLLAASRVLEAAALDPYQFLRDAYFQRRLNLLYDGKPPREDDDPEPPSKPGASNSRMAPPLAGPSDGSYNLAPDRFDGAASSPLELKPAESTARPPALAPGPSKPRATSAAHPATQAPVVRLWLPATR